MPKSLVVVESPAKAKTINKYLGSDYIVKACMGHIKDLPKSKMGVDEEKDFEPHYVIIRGKNDIVKDLKSAAEKADCIYLAPDPDREGEAIAFHLAEELENGKPVYRVILNEITKAEVLHAFANPTEIDEKKVQAQQTRRILDRLVGYKLSPLLWQKVKRGLSAGRVQSIALRLICDREREILSFVPEEYWTLTAFLEAAQPPVFPAKLARKNGEKISVGDQQTADQILSDLKDAEYSVKNIEKKQRKRHAPAPYITSKLQQEASRKFRWPVKKVMMVAQELYEGIELGSEGAVGLITYMRTDSVRVSDLAVGEARSFIPNEYGQEFLPQSPNFFKNKKSVQDAHEAIRPTSVFRTPDSVKQYLSRDEQKLYALIWNRFVGSQMRSAEFDETIVTVAAKDYEFEASGQVMTFPGYLKVYQEETVDPEAEEVAARIPPLEPGQNLRLDRLEPKQNFTQPPSRFTEAALVKELEDKEIGRPSTYAAIISVIQNRNYVIKEDNRFKPVDLGLLISDLLVRNFDELMDFKYTAHLEEELDEIEEGTKESLEVLNEFYGDFTRDLKKAYDRIENIKATGLATDVKCPQCGNAMVKRWGKFGAFLACTNEECKYTQNPDQKPEDNLGGAVGSESEHVCLKCGKTLVVKVGRYGKFLACSGYPDCKFTAKLSQSSTASSVEVPGEKCPQCGSGLVEKQGRFGPFVACSSYPDCKYIKPKMLDVKCPDDAGALIEKRTRGRKIFYGCANYPECKFALWNKPVPQECPACHAPFMLEKYRKDSPAFLECSNKDCKFQLEPEPVQS